MTQPADNAGAADNNDDDKGAGPSSDDRQVAQSMNLDDVHERIQNERGDELTQPDPNDGIENGEDDDAGNGDGNDDDDDGSGAAGAAGDDADASGGDAGAGAGNADNAGDGAAGGAAGDDDAGADDGAAAAAKSAAQAANTKPAEDAPQAPVEPAVDDDITKPGNYKTEFTDLDGNKFYVSDMDQLPDDFEPASQKEYGKSIQSLTREQSKLDADKQAYAADKTTFDNTTQIQTLQKSWTDDIVRLTTEKVLPADPAQRKQVVEGVFEVMESEMKKGNVIDSWPVAHELYQAREKAKADAAAAEAAKKNQDASRKKSGGKVMGGGNGAGSGGGGSGRGKVIEGPPAGVGLDAVHQKVMGSL